MGAFAKLLVGLVLLVVPLALYAHDFVTEGSVYGIQPLQSLWIVLQGTVPPFLMLIGLFVVWLELDELRIEKELKTEEEEQEEKKPVKKTRKKKR